MIYLYPLVLGLPTAIIFVCTALCCPAAWWRFLASSALRAATYILIPCAIEKTVYFFVLPFFFFSLNTITAGQWGVNLFQAFFKETFEEVWEMMQYRVGIVTVFLRLQYCQGMCLVQLGQPENKESFKFLNKAEDKSIAKVLNTRTKLFGYYPTFEMLLVKKFSKKKSSALWAYTYFLED